MSQRTLNVDLLSSEIVFNASRSGGPGGQNVNKVNSKVTLQFDVVNSQILTEEEKSILKAKLASRMTREGVLLIHAQESRSQLDNKELVKENPGHVRAFLCGAEFWDVGTPADYLEACLSIGRTEGQARQLGRRPVVAPSAVLVDSVIWDDVHVGGGAMLDYCVVADGVTIPSGSSFRNCAIIQRDGALVVADIT